MWVPSYFIMYILFGKVHTSRERAREKKKTTKHAWLFWMCVARAALVNCHITHRIAAKQTESHLCTLMMQGFERLAVECPAFDRMMQLHSNITHPCLWIVAGWAWQVFGCFGKRHDVKQFSKLCHVCFSESGGTVFLFHPSTHYTVSNSALPTLLLLITAN